MNSDDDKLGRAQHRYNRYLPLAKYDPDGKKPLGFFVSCTNDEFLELMSSLERLSVEARAKEGLNGVGIVH